MGSSEQFRINRLRGMAVEVAGANPPPNAFHRDGDNSRVLHQYENDARIGFGGHR
jgi:hypothetical protein